MKSSRFSFERSVILTRRTATVTTSAPDTSIAFRVSAKSLYLPVPTQSRDLNSRPAMINRSSYMRASYFHCIAGGERSAADEAQNFHSISFFETSPLKVLPIKDFKIQLHSDPFHLDLQLAEQIAHRRTRPAIARLAVDLNLHGISHDLSS